MKQTILTIIAMTGMLIQCRGAAPISFSEGLAVRDRFQFANRLFRWDSDLNGNALIEEDEASESMDGGISWAPIDTDAYNNCIDWRRVRRFEQEASYVYKTVENRELSLYVHYPDDWQVSDSRPAIVWFYGGAWNTGSPLQFYPKAEYFAKERGMVNIRVDYRVFQRDGHADSDAAATMDAKSAMRWVRKNAGLLGVDPDRIIAGGDSAGGHLALATWIADEQLNDPNDDASISARADAFVLENPYVPFPAGDPASVWPVLTNSPPPMWIAYGTADIAAYSSGTYNGSNYIAAALAEGVDVTTYIVEGAGHGFCTSSTYLAPSTDEIDQFLVAKGFLSGPAGTLPTQHSSVAENNIRSAITAGTAALCVPNYGQSINNASLVESVTVPQTVGSTLSVSFAYDMNTNTLAAGIIVSNQTLAAVVPGSWSHSSGRTYNFTPVSSYIEDNEYSVMLTAGLADSSANAQVIERIAHFRPGSFNDDADIWVRLGITDVPSSGTVVYDTTANWSSQSVADTNYVVIENGATVTLDQSDTAAIVQVIGDGVLNIDQNVTLTAASAMQLGVAGAGTVNQSTGALITSSLTLNSSAMTNLSQYNLSGGSVDAMAITVNENGQINLTGGTVDAAALTVASGGLVEINGGTFGYAGSGAVYSGEGLVRVQSGTLAIGEDTNDGLRIDVDVEVSGGTVSLDGQFGLGNISGEREFKIIGDDAVISARHIQQSDYFVHGNGKFSFILDESGVSPITVRSWSYLDTAKIHVDGSAYTGGAASIMLIDGVNMIGLAASSNMTVTGFSGGLSATVVQENHDVRLEITDEPVVTAATFVPWQDGNWSVFGTPGTWGSNESGSWGWAARAPGIDAEDDVAINASKTVSLNIDATVGLLQVQNDTNSATLNINTAGTTLTVKDHTTIGQSYGEAGTVNVIAGTLAPGGDVTVNSTGLVDIDGGTFACVSNVAFSGGGQIRLQSGTFSSLGGIGSQIINLDDVNLEISNGALTLENQVWLGQTADTELKIIGDAATITMTALNQQGHTPNGTFNFVLDETGVSPVDITSWMHLTTANVIVDGSLYNLANGTDIVLFDAPGLNNLLVSSNLTVIGLGNEGSDWSLYQDAASGNVGLTLSAVVNDPIGDIIPGGLVDGDMVFSWQTTLGQSYSVLTNADLTSTNWGIFDTVVGDGGFVSVTNTPNQGQLFYKITSP